MVDAIGGGLIGVGALLLVTTLWWPVAPREIFGLAEHSRAERNSNVAVLVSAVATFGGAVLLLIRSELLWALAGVAFGGVLYYATLAAWTHREWIRITHQVAREREAGDGRITVRTANRMGFRNDLEIPSNVPHLIYDSAFGAHAEEVAVRNARWRWALRHPRGGGWDRLNV